MFDDFPPQAATFLAAELLCLVIRANDIQVLVKRKPQRIQSEQRRVERGLLRSLVLEILVFVPASAYLILLIEPLILPEHWTGEGVPKIAVYSTLGLVSYGFPFAAFRRVMTHLALKTLQEFASITGDSHGGSNP